MTRILFFFFGLPSGLLLVAIFSLGNTRSGSERIHDLIHPSETICEQSAVDSLLGTFDRCYLSELGTDFSQKTGTNKRLYKNMLGEQQYYCVPKKRMFDKVVADFRIADFISKDERLSLVGSSDTLYWQIDPQLLHCILALQDSLEAKGLNANGFSIESGHRHPKHNQKIGGAKKSQHVLGKAVDLKIGDINGDGRYTQKDKKIVLDLCENSIIAKRGGVGRYPGSRTIHIDLRGYPARWDNM